MPAQITEYRCLLISPSDVEEERAAVADAVSEWNAHVGKALQIRVELVRWETHATPQLGGRPQELLNRQIVDECDLGIAVFWKRMGTPTGCHASGSVEEIRELLGRGCEVLVYFCERPVDRKEAVSEQYRDVTAFREEIRTEGVLGTFVNKQELKSQVTLHLTKVLADLHLARGGAAMKVPSAGSFVQTSPTPDVHVRIAHVIGLGGTLRRDSEDYICVTVENRSPVPVYISQIALSLVKENRHLLPMTDVITGQPPGSRIEPGDAYSFYMDPEKILLGHQLTPKDFLCVKVADKVGRTWETGIEDTREVLRSALDAVTGS